MNITAALSSIHTSSSPAPPSSGETIIAKVTARPVRGATSGPSPWRPILDAYGREILECASDQFLDLATAQRLETINKRDLVSLLARAGRLGYMETDFVEDNAVYPRIHEAHKGAQPHVNVSPASMVSDERIGQGHSDSTASPQPYLCEASREPKRRKTDERALRVDDRSRTRAQPTRPGPDPLEKQGSNSVKRRRGGARIRGQRLTSATASGKSGRGRDTKVGTPVQVKVPAPGSSNSLERRHIQHTVVFAPFHRQIGSIPRGVLPSLLNLSLLQTRNQNHVRTTNTRPTRFSS